MRLAVYVSAIVLLTIISLVCFLAILFYLDPKTIEASILFLFYFTLFIGLAGFLTLLGFLIRYLAQGRFKHFSESRIFVQLEASFRQSVLLSVILNSALILQSQRILIWWNLLGIVVVVGLIEWWWGKR